MEVMVAVDKKFHIDILEEEFNAATNVDEAVTVKRYLPKRRAGHCQRMTRVAITGIGLITPVDGKEECWAAPLSGLSGIRPVTSFDTSRFPVHLGAEVPAFDPCKHLGRLDPAVTGRASQLAVAAARMAFEDAALDPEDLEPQRTGVSMGTTSGEPRSVEHNDIRQRQGLEAIPGGIFARDPCQLIPAHVASFEAASRVCSIVLFDAFNLRGGPIASIPLPRPVHPGFHTTFIPLMPARGSQ
jgi:hypothetical protein